MAVKQLYHYESHFHSQLQCPTEKIKIEKKSRKQFKNNFNLIFSPFKTGFLFRCSFPWCMAGEERRKHKRDSSYQQSESKIAISHSRILVFRELCNYREFKDNKARLIQRSANFYTVQMKQKVFTATQLLSGCFLEVGDLTKALHKKSTGGFIIVV